MGREPRRRQDLLLDKCIKISDFKIKKFFSYNY